MQSDAPGAEYTVPIQRVAAVVQLARCRGWDTDAMLAAADITPSLLVEGRSRVTVGQAAVMFRQLWQATDDELLGLGLGPVPRGTLRLLCFGLLTAPNLHAAAQRFESFQHSVPGLPPLTLSVEADAARIWFDISAVAQPSVLVVDTMLAVTHRFIGWTIGRRVQLRRVEVPHPPSPEIDDYDLIFGAPVTFAAPAPALVFDAELLDAPLIRTDDDLIAFLQDAPIGVIAGRDYAVSLTSQVRRFLQRGLTGDWPTIDDIAAELAMSPQTLRRKLREDGTSPREIRAQVLRDAAITALVRGDETVNALSRRLGFSEPSAFSRAFRRWTGGPPGWYQRTDSQ